jgi:Spy/CpxP family protein refolding chaperone
MTTKRTSLLAGTILGGALLLGTASLALAQDPTTTPAPSATEGTFGGMMGGQSVQGMMGGQSVQGMMGGIDAGDIAAMHRAMGRNGTCDPTLMKSIHGRSGRAGS